MKKYENLAQIYHKALFNLCLNITGDIKSALALADIYIKGVKENGNYKENKRTKAKGI